MTTGPIWYLNSIDGVAQASPRCHEPTNHLDLATKEMLVDAPVDFEGTMVFVLHDRAFLRGLSNRVLELGGESGQDREPHLYPGSYVKYVERTGHEAPGVHG